VASTLANEVDAASYSGFLVATYNYMYITRLAKHPWKFSGQLTTSNIYLSIS